MPIIQLNDKYVLFIHIPKTGGASIEQAFRNFGKVSMFDARHNNPNFHCSPQHFHLAPLKRLLPFDLFLYKFTIVRNPFSRLVSEYRMRFGNKFLKGDSIPAFDQWVESIFLEYKKNNWLYDNHIRPQTEFINNTLVIFRFEEGIPSIIEKLHLQINLPLPEKSLPHRQKSILVPVSLSTETVAAIVEFYNEDFCKLNYPTVLPEELSSNAPALSRKRG